MAYYNPTLNIEDLLKRLQDLDDDLFLYSIEQGLSQKRIDVIIAGSSSLILNGITIPVTEDIDVLKLTAHISEELLKKYDMNTRVMALENSLPYNYEDRIIKLDINTKILNYWLLSIEDAVIGKIQAGRGKDWHHLEEENLKEMIDWAQLKISAEEMKMSLYNEEQYRWFLSRYNYFVEVHGHEEVIIKDI